MNVLKKRPLYILILLGFSFILTACGQKSMQNDGLTGKNGEGLKVQSGSVLLEEKGEYSTLNFLNGKYSSLNSKNIVTNYNKESGTYIFLKDGKHYIYYKGKNKEITDKEYSFIKISPSGNYVSYMIYDNGYKLKVLSLEDNKVINIQSKVAISGEFYDFINGDTLVYYGISDDGVNGVFTYNLKTNKEELLYKLKVGYVEFLKGLENEVVIFQQLSNNKKELKIISDTKKEKVISKSFNEINDVLKVNNDYYILGTAINNSPSLYKVKENSNQRLVYSFPSIINLKKGIRISDNGDILFIGSNNGNDKEEIFSYKDKSVSLISSKIGNYEFIKFN